MLGNKKGISPLIATVLIIGFTIVAAVIVISWISSLIDETTDTQSCKAEALAKCIENTRDFSYSADYLIGLGIGGAKISNSGSDDATFTVVYLDNQGNSICVEGNVSVPSFSSNVQAPPCPASSGGATDSVTFIQEVSATISNKQCTESCGSTNIKAVQS